MIEIGTALPEHVFTVNRELLKADANGKGRGRNAGIAFANDGTEGIYLRLCDRNGIRTFEGAPDRIGIEH